VPKGKQKDEASVRESVIEEDVAKIMKESYINYAMSVIVSRALPDVRDGLKPVHRKILFTLKELGLFAASKPKKSVRSVGDCLGKYHPHGDTAVYDAMVRMAQNFSLRYPLIDGHGNFGSLDGDPPAAMRYTESRLTLLAEEMLRDLDKDTVDFCPNFDDTMEEPTVLPSGFPNLLVNGSSGIAVGMATSMPPHNLGEIIDGLIFLIGKEEAKDEDILKFVKGPDFPTGGVIIGSDGIREAYLTGRGKVIVRGRVAVEGKTSSKNTLVMTEIPYAVSKPSLIEKIALLCREGEMDEISDIRDLSNKEGMKVLFELKKGTCPDSTLQKLYKKTDMQVNFTITNLVIVDGSPQVLSLKQLMQKYIEFQREVYQRRTRFLLSRCERKLHLLLGLAILSKNIDKALETIKNSRTVQEAKAGLEKNFLLSEAQAAAILDLKLQKLASVELSQILMEQKETEREFDRLKGILVNKKKIDAEIVSRLKEVRSKFGDPRRTELT